MALSSAYPRIHRREGQKRYKNKLKKKSKVFVPIEKGMLESVNDRGKAALTAIQYSAPDRAILFSFYNHPQPLWVWADGTSISFEMPILHVDEG